MLGLKKVLAMILMTVLFTSSILVSVDYKAEAATLVNISVENFSEYLAKELDLSAINGSYLSALIEKSIIKDGDFASYQKNITRGDALVLLNRADEYLYGDTLDAELVQTAISKRISDINKVSTSKQTEVAKAYLKGYISGFSNGKYCTDRDLRLTKKITMSGAVECIAKLKDKSKRAKISPDGQLIRTTNLPKNAKLFPYILASYPNKYYEWQLLYQRSTHYDANGEQREYKNLVEYASPTNIDKLDIDDYSDFVSIREDKLDEWVEKAKKHIELVFNVDYRTIGDSWVDAMMKVNYQNGTDYDFFPKKQLNSYITKMKSNKSIVELKTYAVDGSSLYYFNKFFYMRIYVKYRIKSSIAKPLSDVDELLLEKPYDKILFSNGFVNISGYKLNEWQEGYFDIALADANADGNIGVHCIRFDSGKVLD